MDEFTADPCPTCKPNTVCRTPSCGRLKGKRQEPVIENKQAAQGKDILSTPHPKHFGIPVEHWEAAKNYAEYLTQNEQAEPVAADHTGLIKRIDAAIERVTQGRGLMSIPADPRSDVDLVLSECKALLQGENPPFWAIDFYPAQPVQSGGAQGEPDFWSWVHKAYREPESTNFTIHNMEVAYQAGRVAAEAEKAKGGAM